MSSSSASSGSSSFEAPHPGSPEMPRWNAAELVDAPRFTWRNWFALLGPGLLMGGAAIGGGEWLTGPLVTARYGGALLWLATISILGQVVYNTEISRYTLYCGEPIFTGKFRTLPGPMFWVCVYLVLDFGSVFPYLASSAATPLASVILGHIPDTNNPEATVRLLGATMSEATLLRALGYAIFLTAMIPLIFGGKIYNALKLVMTFKIFSVFGFLIVLGLFYSHADTWSEIFTGFFKFGNVPIQRAEYDLNENGILDPEEDWDGDGHRDMGEDTNYNGQLDPGEDLDGDGELDLTEPPLDPPEDLDGDGVMETFVDFDGDTIRDGDNIDNIFLALWEGRAFPAVDLSMIGILCAMIAISGNGGLSNTPMSNYTRDQGWGMGHHVGAIPSVVGGRNLSLSHMGSVFEVNAESLPRWRRWYRHLLRDQMAVWMPACFLGLALPSMLSVEFLKRGTVADTWTAAGMSAGGVQTRVTEVSGAALGNAFWFMTLFCGFLVLAPSMASTADGVVRRWVDVLWTASPRLRRLKPERIRIVYFTVLCCYATFGLTMLTLTKPDKLLTITTNIYNYALGFSCWHAMAVNVFLLPRELRPNWFIRIALGLAGAFFFAVAVLTTYSTYFGAN